MSRYWNDVICHFGIKHRSGRYKWGSGERPFQGEGGLHESNPFKRSTATSSKATKPYDITDLEDISIDTTVPELSTGQKIRAHATPNIAQGKGKADKSAFEVTADNVSRGLDATTKAVSSAKGLKSSVYDAKLAVKASKMTDEELRSVINRKNLERQYVQAVSDPSTTRGYEVANTILSTTGAIVGIGSGIAGIYSAFHHN